MTGMVWGMGLQIRLPQPDGEGRWALPKTRGREQLRPLGDGHPAPAALLPAGLVVLTWFASGLGPSQQRHYIATATLLIVLGTATAANPWVRRFSASVMGLTIVLVVGSLLVG